ncbi:hypothetical protein DKT77_07735 [Meridianimarinicoccus roseus]|uniref:PA14 domain-containing protein n=1 Tax=Meridianimarinicoccus roseus TaxID=2072018 RepID=A0A2V2LMZ4_9RHOB|nr:hypothetical protein [Meridianimarinicoccus roseus]PWR03103.1 hypothetical protein DKT77_07735 [Meridianimarinicoccus roseus]
MTCKTIKALAEMVLLVLCLCSPVGAVASTVTGMYWKSNAEFFHVNEAIGFANNNADSPTATFTSSGIDYPNGKKTLTSSSTLTDFLGVDAATIKGDGSSQLATSVFYFTGMLNLFGSKTLKVGSDDGFVLALDGTNVMWQATNRAFGYTSTSYDFTGQTRFSLLYYENKGNTGVEFSIDDWIVGRDPQPSKVPIPAALPALATGLAGLILLNLRARRTAARRRVDA